MDKRTAMAATLDSNCICWDAAEKLKAALYHREPEPCPVHAEEGRRRVLEAAQLDAYTAIAEEARSHAQVAEPALNSPTLVEQVRQTFEANAVTSFDDDTPPAA